MIPKAGGKLRRLGIPTLRDRVVQAALSAGSLAKLYETRQDDNPKEVEGAHSELVA
jgi:hypothetical protein